MNEPLLKIKSFGSRWLASGRRAVDRAVSSSIANAAKTNTIATARASGLYPFRMGSLTYPGIGIGIGAGLGAGSAYYNHSDPIRGGMRGGLYGAGVGSGYGMFKGGRAAYKAGAFRSFTRGVGPSWQSQMGGLNALRGM